MFKSLIARQVFDSRGNPTVEVEVKVDGVSVISDVPSGASTGTYEALELKDEIAEEYGGKGIFKFILGVSKAVENINGVIKNMLQGYEIESLSQEQLDKLLIDLDGTPNKSKLGANAILAVSMAFARYQSHINKIPLYQQINDSFSRHPIKCLPVPFFNVLNGGVHSGNQMPFQELMIAPVGAKSFHEAMKIGTRVYSLLKKLINDKYGAFSTNVGDEGGFAPNILTVQEGLDLLTDAIQQSGYKNEVKIAIDVAASEMYDKEKKLYDIGFKTAKRSYLSGQELLSLYQKLCAQYPIISIEDPFDQDDWENWICITEKLKIQIVADDLTVTNVERLSKAIKLKAANALLLKINQIGTVAESLTAAKMAFENGWNVMVSHRSGETEDTFISDLSVGIGCGQMKSGAPCRSERVAKYNRLLRIESDGRDEIKLKAPDYS